MFFILLVVSLMSFLRDPRVAGCDKNCPDKPVFTPSTLVVRHGDQTSARCDVCPSCTEHFFSLEKSVGDITFNGSTVLWTVQRMTEWDTKAQCYYNNASDYQCCSILPVTVYKPPDSVSISFKDHSGPMIEHKQYALQCEVRNVAPLRSLRVTFYRGHIIQGETHSMNTQLKKPGTEVFTQIIHTLKEDDGVQYWCEAKLDLGPEGPQPPPVVTSEKITAMVHYKPQLVSSFHPNLTLTEGDSVQLNCSCVGNPAPRYTWTLPGPNSTFFAGNTLIINSVNSKDAGQYICLVRNDVGATRVEFDVAVKVLERTTNPLTTSSSTVSVPNRSTSSTLVHRFIMCSLLISVSVSVMI